MSEPKHSPLPWTDDGLDRFSGNEEWCWSIMSGADLVATVPTQHFTQPEASLDAEAKANAELIVRSVNAHEALVEALEALLTSERIAHSNPCQEKAVESLLKQTAPKCRCGRDPMVEKARAALALAKRETK